jgi:hypothetical protein
MVNAGAVSGSGGVAPGAGSNPKPLNAAAPKPLE